MGERVRCKWSYAAKWRKSKKEMGKKAYIISIIYGADILFVSEVVQTGIKLIY